MTYTTDIYKDHKLGTGWFFSILNEEEVVVYRSKECWHYKSDARSEAKEKINKLKNKEIT